MKLEDCITELSFCRGEASASFSPSEKALRFLMDSQNENGGWGGEDFSVWNPVVTAYIIQALLSAGFDTNTKWTIFKNQLQREGNLEKSIKWLCLQQKSDGSFGEDFWDTCVVLRTLLMAGMPKRDVFIQKGLAYVREKNASGLEKNFGNLEWFGSAFVAQALLLFKQIADQKAVNELRKLLVNQQNEDGSFQSRKGIYPTFHAAQATLALAETGFSPDSKTIQNGIGWLKNSQNEDGSWEQVHLRIKAILTSHAILCLCALEGIDSESVKKGVDYLVNNQQENGIVIDLPSSSMAALVFSKFSKEQLFTKVNIANLSRIIDGLQNAKEEIDNLQKQIESMQQESTSLRDTLNETLLKLTEFDKLKNEVESRKRLDKYQAVGAGAIIFFSSAVLFLYCTMLLPQLYIKLLSWGLSKNAVSVFGVALVPALFYYPFSLSFVILTKRKKVFSTVSKFVTSTIVIGFVITLILELLTNFIHF